VPRRRCIGCGRIAPKAELVRLAVRIEDRGRSRRAVIDPAGTLPGRGAYLCAGPGDTNAPTPPNPDCLQLAERRRGVARALRCPATLDPEIVESVIR
jgi:predicted RNA-binding protein YlxR (DUF448 family)